MAWMGQAAEKRFVRVGLGVPEAAGRGRCQKQDRVRHSSDSGGNRTSHWGKKIN